MQRLGAAVAVFAALTLAAGAHLGDANLFLLAAAAGLCAFTTWRSAAISSFLKIFVSIFSVETIVFGAARLLAEEGLWPAALADYALPESLPLTVAVFSIAVFAVSHIPVVREMTRIADLYFDSSDRGEGNVLGLFRFGARERSIAVAMIVLLVLINQAQVGVNVRLSFFNRDFFNAIQEKNADAFWSLLLFVFTPWAFTYIISAVIEYVVQSLMIIRWRRWLTEHYVVPLARRSHALSNGARRQSDRQSGPAHRRGCEPLHRRRHRWLRHLLLFDPADPDAELARLLLHRPLGTSPAITPSRAPIFSFPASCSGWRCSMRRSARW